MRTLSELPEELLVVLFEFILPFDLRSCRCVCVVWSRLSFAGSFEGACVSGGIAHSLAMFEGYLYCWGDNQYSQCYEIPEIIIESPYRINGMRAGVSKNQKTNRHYLISVAAGQEHSLGLTTGLQIVVWGDDLYKKELGRGFRIINEGDLAPKSVIQIAAGSGYSLALTDQGECFSWGSNAFGELGLGHLTAISVPVKVDLPTKVTYISVTKSHWSAAMLVATEEGQVYGWGSNFKQKISNNNVEKYFTEPQLLSLNNLFVVQVACGAAHSLVLTKEGLCYMWGDNAFGQFGATNTVQGYSQSSCITSENNIVKIVAGNNHNLALSRNGWCFSWGRNEYGQLGHTVAFSKVRISKQILDVSAGGDHSLFLCAGNSLYACGRNTHSQLAVPLSTASLDRPVLVFGKQRCCCQ